MSILTDKNIFRFVESLIQKTYQNEVHWDVLDSNEPYVCRAEMSEGKGVIIHPTGKMVLYNNKGEKENERHQTCRVALHPENGKGLYREAVCSEYQWVEDIMFEQYDSQYMRSLKSKPLSSYDFLH
jgi:hypothetical protein